MKICLKFENFELLKKLISLLIPFDYLDYGRLKTIKGTSIAINC